MTDEQKYSAVLKELGALLQSKNTTIACDELIIKDLQEKLAAADEEIEQLRLQIKELDAALDAAMKGGAV